MHVETRKCCFVGLLRGEKFSFCQRAIDFDLEVGYAMSKGRSTKGGYLAIVKHETMPDPWSTLSEIIARYRTDAGYRPYDMIEAFEQYGLFQKVGERMTAPVPFVQSIDDYIESYHSRSGFSRERMGSAQAPAFDQEARNILLKSHSDGMIIFQVTGSIVWGFPRGR